MPPRLTRRALESAVRAALTSVIDPEIRKPITELDMVESVSAGDDGRVRRRHPPDDRRMPRLRPHRTRRAPGRRGRRRRRATPTSTLSVMTPEQRAALTERLRGGRAARGNPFGPGSLTRVIAVTSGKGGVGKSTITANLAVALAARGLSVGLVDADVHGFSIPGLLGLVDEHGIAARPTRVDEMILPPVAHGVKVISIGMFVEPTEPGGRASSVAVAWRGPMLHRTLNAVPHRRVLRRPRRAARRPAARHRRRRDLARPAAAATPRSSSSRPRSPPPPTSPSGRASSRARPGQRIVGVVENMAGFAQPDGEVLELFGAGGGATRRRAALRGPGRARAAARERAAQHRAAAGRRRRRAGRRSPRPTTPPHARSRRSPAQLAALPRVARRPPARRLGAVTG